MAREPNRQPKSAAVTRMLSRANGATTEEIVKATGWKQHSCRAFLTGIRKTRQLLKELRSDGSISYRLEAAATQAEQ